MRWKNSSLSPQRAQHCESKLSRTLPIMTSKSLRDNLSLTVAATKASQFKQHCSIHRCMLSRNRSRKSCRPRQGTILSEACPYRPRMRASACAQTRVPRQRRSRAERETRFRLHQGRRVWQHAFLVGDQPFERNWPGGVPLQERRVIAAFRKIVSHTAEVNGTVFCFGTSAVGKVDQGGSNRLSWASGRMVQKFR